MNTDAFRGTHQRSHSTKVLKNTVWTTVFGFVCLITVFPFIYSIFLSLKPSFEIMMYPGKLLPNAPTIENYVKVFTNDYINYGRLFFNSVKITAINVTGCVVTSLLAGYAFGRLTFKGRDVIFLLFLATLMIPPQVTLIPKFMLFSWLGLVDTHYSLILPGLVSILGTFLMRQHMMKIPFEVSESAYIDGASEHRTFYSIVMPMAKPAIAAVVVLTISWHWMDYENPLVFLSNKALFTLPLGLNAFADESGVNFELISAASMITAMPLIVVFIFAQDLFIRGLSAGSVKG